MFAPGFKPRVILLEAFIFKYFIALNKQDIALRRIFSNLASKQYLLTCVKNLTVSLKSNYTCADKRNSYLMARDASCSYSTNRREIQIYFPWTPVRCRATSGDFKYYLWIMTEDSKVSFSPVFTWSESFHPRRWISHLTIPTATPRYIRTGENQILELAFMWNASSDRFLLFRCWPLKWLIGQS